jgi:hypothetical protein
MTRRGHSGASHSIPITLSHCAVTLRDAGVKKASRPAVHAGVSSDLLRDASDKGQQRSWVAQTTVHTGKILQPLLGVLCWSRDRKQEVALLAAQPHL